MEYEHFVGIVIGIILTTIVAGCICHDGRTPQQKIADEIAKQEKVVETRYNWYITEQNKLEQMKEVIANDNNRASK